MTPVVGLYNYLVVGAILFVLGVAGFILRRNIITVFMCIELMLNAVNLSFVAFSNIQRQVTGHIFTFFVMVVAAAEAAVGLAIILTVFKNRDTLNIDEIDTLKNLATCQTEARQVADLEDYIFIIRAGLRKR